MKKLDLSAISSSNGMPQKSGVLEHIQSAYQEAIAATIKALLGSTTYNAAKAYVLHGVVNSGSGSNYSISAGAIFYNGEVFLVDAATFTITGANVAVGVISTTYYSATNADPVIFTDGVSRNIHQIRKIVMQPGLSGSGAADFVDFIYLSLVQKNEVLTKTNTTSFTPSADYQPATKKYVDDTAGSSGLRPKLYGNEAVGNIPYTPGYLYKTVNLGTTLPSANYIVLMNIVSANPNHWEDSQITYSVFDKKTTEFSVCVKEFSNANEDISFDWMLFQA